MITQNELKALLSYNQKTGHFTWRVYVSSRGLPGERAGHVRTQKAESGRSAYARRFIMINGQNYLEHRLVFLYMTGEMPPFVSHKNENKLDNRWKNLRIVNRAQANQASALRRDNSSGFKGIQKMPDRWRVFVRGQYLGTFRSEDMAKAAYNKAAKMAFGEFARTHKENNG